MSKNTDTAIKKPIVGEDPIWDANQLSKGNQLLLGLQHLFAMFGATVLVPLLTGLDISTTLFMSGIGTLIFHLITKRKVPAYLGSSFSFLAGYAALAPLIDGQPNTEMLPYANGGIFVSGILFIVFAGLIRYFGANRIMRFFPPIVTGPMIIVIGIGLAPGAIGNASTNWLLAGITFAVIVFFNIWGKGMSKVIPIMIGVIVGYVVALFMHEVDFSHMSDLDAFGIPFATDRIMKFNWESIAVMVPISLATLMEHVGDISAISSTTGKNYVKDPGLHRTLLGDGLATSFSTAFGGPDMTTYGENIGVMALTKVYSPKVMRIAAVIAVILAFFPGVSGAIRSIPDAVIGGTSIILYGMIASTGVRTLVDNRTDFSKSRNMIIAGVIFVTGLGLPDGLPITATFSLPGIAVAAVVGIFLNIILPGNDYVFNIDEPESTGVDFSVRNREDELLVEGKMQEREVQIQEANEAYERYLAEDRARIRARREGIDVNGDFEYSTKDKPGTLAQRDDIDIND